MRKIDELIEDIYLKEEDYKMFTEEPLTEEEFGEITENVLATIKQERAEKVEGQFSHQETISLEGKVEDIKRRKASRWILPLVATLTIGSSLIAGVASGSLGEIFQRVFGDNVSNIGESGLALGVSDVNQGIILNVEGIVGDKQTAIVLFDLAKEDGKSFEGNSIRFGKFDFEVEEDWNIFKSFGQMGSSSSYGYGLIDEAYQTPNKRIFQLDAALDQEIIGKEAIVEITDIIETEQGDWDSEVDLGTLFETHPEYLEQLSIPMPPELVKHTSEEELKYEGFEEAEIKEILEDIPTQGLPSRGLNIDLYPELNSDWKIDNIGFIDNKLHIRMYGTGEVHYTPQFIDTLGNQVEVIYNITTRRSINEEEERLTVGYYIYDIKDLEALSHLQVNAWFNKEIRRTEGNWKVRFKIDIKNQEKQITTNQTIPWMDHTNLTIEDMRLSNLSLQVTYLGERLPTYPTIKIRFKDGTEQGAHSQSSTYSKNQVECTYAFNQPIDVAEVEAILIQDVEIKVE